MLGEGNMISPEIEETIKECAREFDVKTVWLFGSSLERIVLR